MASKPKPQEDEPTREEIESRMDELRDRISSGAQRLPQLQYMYSIARTDADKRNADDKVRDCEEALRQARQELDGLTFGLGKASEREETEREEVRVAGRRELSRDLLSLVHQHFWAAQELDFAIGLMANARRRIDELAGRIALLAKGSFPSTKQGEAAYDNFLMGIDCLGLTHTNYRLTSDMKNGVLRSYSQHLPTHRPAALRALATALPEVLDEQLQEEAIEQARQEAAAAEEGGGQ